jgi:starch synthase/alpha-amylase
VDLLTSGVFGAHYVNTVSPTFLREIVEGKHEIVFPALRTELKNKIEADCATGILNAPDPSFNPETDIALDKPYGPGDHKAGKTHNKLVLQKMTGLTQDPDAPLFFWPSRLDRIQKGCQLLADILYHVTATYRKQNLQIIFVANGDFRAHFTQIVQHHNLYHRVAICDFTEQLSRLAYAGSDFLLMPSLFEPCGLPQMIGPIYGTLPVAHDTGGIHDTVEHLDVANSTGNGFLFKNHDSGGLFWAISEAMGFYSQCSKTRSAQIKRIMKQSLDRFNHEVSAKQYIDLYEKMLHRPLIT